MSTEIHDIIKYIGLAITLYLAINAHKLSERTDEPTPKAIYNVGAFLLCASAFIILTD